MKVTIERRGESVVRDFVRLIEPHLKGLGISVAFPSGNAYIRSEAPSVQLGPFKVKPEPQCIGSITYTYTSQSINVSVLGGNVALAQTIASIANDCDWDGNVNISY